MSDEPAVPLLKPVAQQAMGLSSALRQAAIDVPALPPGHHLVGTVEPGAWGVAYVVRAKHVSGSVAWSQGYDGQGRRLTFGVSITPGSK